MAKLDWEKARRKERRRPKGNRMTAEKRRQALADFALKHDLACFGCGTKTNWATAGTTPGRGPWAICVECVLKNKRKA